MINSNSTGIKIEGHHGTWYVIDSSYLPNGLKCFLMEHEKYGEDAAHVIVTGEGKIVKEDVYNGFDF